MQLPIQTLCLITNMWQYVRLEVKWPVIGPWKEYLEICEHIHNKYFYLSLAQ
jgi:hypothetical protein